MTARDDILDRIRRATRDAGPVVVHRDYLKADEERGSLELLVDRLEDYKAVVHRVSASQVNRSLEVILRGRVVAPAGFPRDWLANIDWVSDDQLTTLELDALDGVVTTCAVAIAETGTIVLDAGPGQGRRALTLVPDLHVVVVQADQVVATVRQALARLDPTRPQTWISGPSATSDIELQRVEGVHGPRRLEVVLAMK